MTPDNRLERVEITADKMEGGRLAITRESSSTQPRHLFLGYDTDELRAIKTAIEKLLAQID